ncbi:MAG TPA: hypothetical protein VER17_15840 [Tepidisphaeraceae bacterium]|nr:hypothetical protein [Tepidisphaeraceae bacterium]
MTRWTTLVAAALTFALQAVAIACPMCKESVPSSDAQAAGGVPSGFNNSIYLMLAALVGVLGMVAFTLVKGARGSAAARHDGRHEGRRGFPLP